MSPRTHHQRGVRAATAALLALALLTVGCSSPDEVGSQQRPTDETLPDEGAAQDGGALVVGIYQETSGWNPTYDRWAQMGALVGSAILEPLAALDGNGVAQPWLATSWESNPGFTSWTIKLREGVVFQDGTAFDADSVMANRPSSTPTRSGSTS
jgi:ABC-type transport system substrate-binding protein